MDLFDERILATLKDGKPRGFDALLGEVGFSHNTLQQHLERALPKSENKTNDHFTPISGQASALTLKNYLC